MSTIHIFGNPLLPFDSLPLKFVPKLKKIFPEIDFQLADPNENLKPKNKKLFIIDTIEGIKEVVVVDDLSKINTEKAYSLHDFDLGFNLKLLQKIGELEEVLIIGVPMEVEDEEKTLNRIVEIIRNVSSRA